MMTTPVSFTPADAQLWQARDVAQQQMSPQQFLANAYVARINETASLCNWASGAIKMPLFLVDDVDAAQLAIDALTAQGFQAKLTHYPGLENSPLLLRISLPGTPEEPEPDASTREEPTTV